MDIEFFIESLRESDYYISHLFLNGSCYQFHLLVSKLFPGSEPWIDEKEKHIITRYRGKFYDIRGEISPEGFRPLRDDEIKKWKSGPFRR